jgi:hypothetical protein
MKLSEHFNRFDILNCNDDSFDDHTMNLWSNLFKSFQSPVSCHGIADETTRLVADAILFGGFLGFFFSEDCGIN